MGLGSVSDAVRRSVAWWQGLVGRPPVFGLELVGELRQLRDRPSERAGDAVHRAPGGVLPAGLDVRDPGGLDARVERDGLLFEAELLAA